MPTNEQRRAAPTDCRVVEPETIFHVHQCIFYYFVEAISCILVALKWFALALAVTTTVGEEPAIVETNAGMMFTFVSNLLPLTFVAREAATST